MGTMASHTETKDLIDMLVVDHRELRRIFRELADPGTAPDRKGALASVAIAELVRHSVAEEQYLYPATREALPDGDQIADKELEGHREAERLMKRLERLEPGEAEYASVVQSLIAAVGEHIEDEERNLFPRLREACPPEQLADLGAKIDRAKRIAPTRPHPSAPDRPPANKLLAPGAGLVDRVRDALSQRPTSPDDL
jgi:hemerythrin-like domain-containing protein